MKKLFAVLAVSAAMMAGSTGVRATPANENMAENNPNVVAYYEDGPHTVIHKDGHMGYGMEGADLVMQAGHNFQQWFDDGEGHMVHTLFRNVGRDTECSGNGVFLENPHHPPEGDTWGYYFPMGDNYCAVSNK